MYPNLVVTALGLEMAANRLERISKRGHDLRPLWAGEMTDKVHEFFADQFRTEGRAGGEPWQPLAQSTIERKLRRGTAGNGILVDSGEMKASLTDRSHYAAAHKVTRLALEVWSTLTRRGAVIATLHQFGTVHMPARVISPETIPERYAEQWDDLVLRYVSGEETEA